MSQLPLFAASCVTVVDEPAAHIVYWPACIAIDLAQAWFDAMRRDVAWRSDRRLMYDREVDVPRLMASYRLDQEDLPSSIAAAATVVRETVPVAFNSVGLNLYRDGSDSVALHHDRLGELVPGQPIALLSLGGPRRMTIACKDRARRSIRIDLDPGSLIVMDYASQLHFLHGIGKTRSPVLPRISLAFRVRPQR
jgi:alkylated DNA repair dioxygenase AlkB